MKANDYPAGIIAIYDNGGKTFDRFTVYFKGGNGRMFACLGMSENPFHPQGFGQHSTGMLGRHNGKRISFADLPADCRRCALQSLGGAQ